MAEVRLYACLQSRLLALLLFVNLLPELRYRFAVDRFQGLDGVKKFGVSFGFEVPAQKLERHFPQRANIGNLCSLELQTR